MKSKVDTLLEGLSQDKQISLLKSMLASAYQDIATEKAAHQATRVSYEETMAEELVRFQKEIKKLELKNIELLNRLHAEYKRKYGVRTEAAGQLLLPLFNEFEASFDECAQEPELVQQDTKDTSSKKKLRKKPRRIDTSNMTRTVIMHTLEGQKRICSCCGSELKHVREDVREVVIFVPAHYEVEEHHMEVCVCPTCSEHNALGEETPVEFRRAQMRKLPLEKSWADHSLIAYVLNAKYVNSMPLYRIQADLRSINPSMEITRQTMAGWVISVYRRWFSCIHDRIRKQILSGELIHMDETSVLVLKEPNRRPSSKSYMWVMAAPKSATPACSFEYAPSRGAEVPKRLLEGWDGTLMTDCYSTYFTLTDIKHLACLVHIRREFVQVIDGLDKEALKKSGSLAYEAVVRLARIFAVDNQFNDLSCDKRKERREIELRPLLESFGIWLQENVGKVAPNTKLSRAFNNAIEHWPHVMHVLDNGLFPLDNNLAERYIRPFTVGRKNWLFSDTQDGARASAAIYSIVSTARANGLIPGRYLDWLLDVMPNTDNVSDSDILEGLMPWSPTIPDYLKADASAPRIEPDEPIIDIEPDILDTP